MTSCRADLRLRLLRARELCLLGDYERGIPEFRDVLGNIRIQSTFVTPVGLQVWFNTLSGKSTAIEMVVQFIQELQNEYTTIVQYHKTLRDLGARTQKVRAQYFRPSEAIVSLTLPALRETICTTQASILRRKSAVEQHVEPRSTVRQGVIPEAKTKLQSNRDLGMNKRVPVWARKSDSTGYVSWPLPRSHCSM
jgi:hypothetical protein